MKKLVTAFLVILLIFSTIGCTPSKKTADFPPAYNTEIINLPFSLEWGMSREEAMKVLKVKEADVEVNPLTDFPDIITEYTVIPKWKDKNISLFLYFSTEAANEKVGFDLGLTLLNVAIHDESSYQEIGKQLIGDADVTNSIEEIGYPFVSTKNALEYLKENNIEAEAIATLQKLYSITQEDAIQMLEITRISSAAMITMPEGSTTVNSQMSTKLANEPLYGLLRYSTSIMNIATHYLP